MKRKSWLIGVFLGWQMCLLLTGLWAQGLRKAVWAGQFYEADPNRLSRLLDIYLAETGARSVPGEVVGLIAPHAGYVYSGRVAACGYSLVKGRAVESVVIIGPSHHYGFEGCSIYLRGGFETPLGLAEVDATLARELSRLSGFGYIPEAHSGEHSIEVQVPFIQKVFPGARIVPVVMGYQTERTVQALAGALARLLPGKKALVVASTDLSHFLSRAEANELDQKTIDLIRQLDLKTLTRKMERQENIMCGSGPVLTLLQYARKLGTARVEVLAYSDSAAVGGPADRVVGYLAAAVCLEKTADLIDFSPEEKKELLGLARKAIEVYLESKEIISYQPAQPRLETPAGAFVTLKEHNQLRGCIGFAEPLFPLWQTVAQAAVLAATEDPRFPPLKKSELKELEIEISVLGPLQPVKDVSEIKVGQHGLVIRQGNRSGLLLPQVASELGWDRQTFLRELCRKAGLPDRAWKDLESLRKFEAVVFHD
ncbi:MAG: AmmeMemoRadiSam system protein B [Candidatus Saccharicenans sp.]|uniref:AmmeMemoRadiSam system protein B n=1 Tax=Candidatus Saccharicenans sp. TaxID=2819258 RepID=UPI0040493828